MADPPPGSAPFPRPCTPAATAIIVRLDAADPGLWPALLARRPPLPVGYHRLHCAYQHDYFASAHRHYLALGSWFTGATNRSASGPWRSRRRRRLAALQPPQWRLRRRSALLLDGLSDKRGKAVSAGWLAALAALVAHFGPALDPTPDRLPRTLDRRPRLVPPASSPGALPWRPSTGWWPT